MHSGFVLEHPEGATTLHLKHNFFDATQGRLAGGQNLVLITEVLSIPREHAVEFRRKQRRLVTTRTGPDFYDDVLFIARILLQRRQPNSVFQPLHGLLALRPFLIQKFFHLRIESTLGKHDFNVTQ